MRNKNWVNLGYFLQPFDGLASKNLAALVFIVLVYVLCHFAS